MTARRFWLGLYAVASIAYISWRWAFTLNFDYPVISIAFAVAETYGALTSFFFFWVISERKVREQPAVPGEARRSPTSSPRPSAVPTRPPEEDSAKRPASSRRCVNGARHRQPGPRRRTSEGPGLQLAQRRHPQ